MTFAKTNSSGFTLIEAMVAMAILAVLVIGAAPFMIYGSGGIATCRNKQAALAVANDRLERLRSADYAVLKPALNDYNVYYLNSSLAKSTTYTNETSSISGVIMPVVTTIHYETGSSCEYLHAIVTVNYRTGSSDNVKLETYIGEFR